MRPIDRDAAGRAAALALAVAFLVTALACPALARDLTVGTHCTSQEDWTNTVYASLDGETFWAVSVPYRDQGSHRYYKHHANDKDAGIVWWNGYFWMVSGWDRFDDRMWPLLSYSKDLIHWTHPEADQMLASGSTPGVPLNWNPTDASGRQMSSFDTVAPKLCVVKGQLYLTFSAGYFGAWHNDTYNDRMTVYVAHVTELSAADPTAHDGEWLWPNRLTFRCDTAQVVPATADADYIDPFLVEDAGTVYLAAKKDGETEQLFRSSNGNVCDGSSYQLANGYVSWGHEGVSINWANGIWHLYGDGVVGTRASGMREVASSWLPGDSPVTDGRSGLLDTMHALTFKDLSGKDTTAIHGCEMSVWPGTVAYEEVRAALEATHPEVAAELSRIEAEEGSWWAGGVSECFERGYLKGYGDGSLGVGRTITRTELACLLYNASGRPQVARSGAQAMTDVDEGAWYADAVRWAVANAVLNGVVRPDGTRAFRPDDPVTCEQLAAALYNLAGDGIRVELQGVTDASDVDAWASDAVAWAKSRGIVNGYPTAGGGAEVRPREQVSRERCACVLANALRSGAITTG